MWVELRRPALANSIGSASWQRLQCRSRKRQFRDRLFRFRQILHRLQMQPRQVRLPNARITNPQMVMHGRIETQRRNRPGDTARSVGRFTRENLNPAQRVLKRHHLRSLVNGELNGGARLPQERLCRLASLRRACRRDCSPPECCWRPSRNLPVQGDRFIELAQLLVECCKRRQNLRTIERRQRLQNGERVRIISIVGKRCGDENSCGRRRLGLPLNFGGNGIAYFVRIGGAMQIGQRLVALNR